MMEFIKDITKALGTISAILSIPTIIFSDFTEKCIGENRPRYLGGILIAATLYALILLIPLRSIKLNFKKTFNIKIKSGDLFKQDGIAIIPVNEYFDTIVDDTIISESSIHGQFIKNEFGDNIDELDTLITESLNGVKFQNTLNRENGKEKKYPLGTVVKIKTKEEKIYFLISFTKFNENNRAALGNAEYLTVFTKLLKYIEQFSQGNIINIPLLGAGRSGLLFNKQELLEFCLFLIHINKLSLENGINIILDKKSKKEINLKKIKTFYKIIK